MSTASVSYLAGGGQVQDAVPRQQGSAVGVRKRSVLLRDEPARPTKREQLAAGERPDWACVIHTRGNPVYAHILNRLLL